MAESTTPRPPGWTERHRSLSDLVEPYWEKQPKERRPHFAAFCVYRDLGPNRSLEAVAKSTGLRESNLAALCSRMRWRVRADAYDDETDARRRRDRAEASRAMAHRQAAQAEGFAAALFMPLRVLVERVATMTPDEVRKLYTGLPLERLVEIAARTAHPWSHVVKIERMARGAPVEDLADGDGGPEADSLVDRLSQRPEALAAMHEALLLADEVIDVPAVVEKAAAPPRESLSAGEAVPPSPPAAAQESNAPPAGNPAPAPTPQDFADLAPLAPLYPPDDDEEPEKKPAPKGAK